MELVFRSADLSDLRSLLALLDEGSLVGGHGPTDDDLIRQVTIDGFNRVLASPDNELVVVEKDGKLVGAMQLTFIPGVSFNGSLRLLIEGVRVKSSYRNQGIGRTMLGWAIDRAREKKCHLVQLLSNKRRREAADFYQSIGFKMSHNGFKLFLLTEQ